MSTGKEGVATGLWGHFLPYWAMPAKAGCGCRKGWGRAWRLVVAMELKALGFSAQPGYFQGLLRICPATAIRGLHP